MWGNTAVFCEARNFISRYNYIRACIFAGDTQGEGHVFHLHGHSFHVVRRSKKSSAISLSPAKDSVSVPAGGRVEIRFLADNPGQCENVKLKRLDLIRVLFRLLAASRPTRQPLGAGSQRFDPRGRSVESAGDATRFPQMRQLDRARIFSHLDLWLWARCLICLPIYPRQIHSKQTARIERSRIVIFCCWNIDKFYGHYICY